MGTPQDYDGKLLAAGGVAAVLIRNKEKFLERFCDRAQGSLPSARREPHPVIIDTLPAFVTRLAMALQAIHDLEFASQGSNIAVAHGNERARFTRYSLAEVLEEYQFIREILVDLLRSEGHPSEAEWDVVHRSVDEAMAEAATEYVEVQDNFREMFAAALTHDFRGPLSNAWNYLELMRRDADPQRREDFARRAAQNLERMSRMVAALLDASRSNAGERLALDAEDGEMKSLLLEVVNDLDAPRRQRVVIDIPEECVVFWDRDKLRRAVYNLLDNACKYSKHGSEITLRALSTHGRLQISVHNFGEPIPPEDQPTLFRPFRRTSQAQRSGKAGWGLGLVQVQAIAEAHGGSVAVESDATRGTTFTLDLLRDIRDLRNG
jgi:signal transduction histidine kinase